MYNIINTKSYHFRHCVCRRKGCDHGDICETNSDCGRDKWNRKGKCVITKYKNKDNKKHGPWRQHK